MSTDIDTVYAAFCSELPADLAAVARSLARRVGLAPTDEIRWSEVFKHSVTLAAPLFFAEGMHGLAQPVLELAAEAHLLAVIEAFSVDRIADGQIEDTPALSALLTQMRMHRNRALSCLFGEGFEEPVSLEEERTRAAIARERALFAAGDGVAMPTYRQVSADKQSVGLIASIALATHAGWAGAKLDAVRATLLDVALGLQFVDDVADWEDDVALGGAWMPLLAKRSSRQDAPTEPGPRRAWVESSRVLVDVLELAAACFQEAATAATGLGAVRLAHWASVRAGEARRQRAGEEKAPGYVRRSRSLAAFKAEVIG